MEIPPAPYVALYGSNAGDWRESLIARLDAERIAWFDPTDEGWAGIDETNGDARQADVDRLVANEHRGLRGAACAIFHFRRRVFRGEVDTGRTTQSLASRFELGMLLGLGIPTFLVIEPDVEGRNYLRAAAKLGSHMVCCASLDEAAERAIALLRR